MASVADRVRRQGLEYGGRLLGVGEQCGLGGGDVELGDRVEVKLVGARLVGGDAEELGGCGGVAALVGILEEALRTEDGKLVLVAGLAID